MISLSSSINIYRPVKQVFGFISISENDFQWQYGTLASAQVSEGTTRVGTFFQSIGHLMGHRIQSTFEVTDFEADRKYGFKSISGPMQSQTLYTFEMDKGSTRIDITTQASLINFFQIRENLLEKQMKKQLKENLALLKNILEAG